MTTQNLPQEMDSSPSQVQNLNDTKISLILSEKLQTQHLFEESGNFETMKKQQATKLKSYSQFLGLNLNFNIIPINAIAIYIITIFSGLLITFLNQTTNVLLQTQFHITQEYELIKTSSLVSLYSNIAIVFLSPVGGLLVDLFGRKKTLSSMLIISGPLIALFPLASSLWGSFLILKALINSLGNGLQSNTLISDYIQRDSIGRAVVYNNFAKQLGCFLSPLLFLQLITRISIKNTFNILGAMMVIIGVTLYFIIQDPKVDSLTNTISSQSTLSQSNENRQNIQNNDQEMQASIQNIIHSETHLIAPQQQQFENHYQSQQQSLINRISKIFDQARVEFKSNKTLAFCFMHTFVVRMGIVLAQNAYILLILGRVKDQNEAFAMISLCQGLSSGVNFIIQIPMIKILDKISLRVSLTLSQILRAFSLFLTIWSHNQDKSVLIANIVLISSCNSFSNVVRDTLFQKNQGSSSRGVINSLMDVASNLGMLSFTIVLAFASLYLSLSGCLCIMGCFDLLVLGASQRFAITKKVQYPQTSSTPQNESIGLNIPFQQQQSIIESEILVEQNLSKFDQSNLSINQIDSSNLASNQNMQNTKLR